MLLRTHLTEARRVRDRERASVLRSALAAIENAEAVSVDQAIAGGSLPGSEHVAGARTGVGAAEAERRELTDADERAVVAAEVAERRAAAGALRSAGARDAADALDRGTSDLEAIVAAS